MEINQAIELMNAFQKGSLKNQIRSLENNFIEKTPTQIKSELTKMNIDVDALEAALTIKKVSSQIDVIVHTIGISLSLPYILEKDEIVQELSIGAGSTGKPFDLTSNKQIAEFKFFQWQEKGNANREKHLFKDFFYLAEFDTNKKKRLYVVHKNYALRFLNSDRTIEKVTNINKTLASDFDHKFGKRFSKIGQYFQFKKKDIEIVDLLELFPDDLSQLFR